MEGNIVFEVGKSIQLRVKRDGMFQRVIFKMIAEPSPAGSYKLLDTDRQIGIKELTQLSDKIGLPVRAAGITVFPKGKSSKDFLI
ncbi:MAG: hypothetical protein ACP5H8_03910 [Candidatus Micrarchaeia archaeon]